MVVPAVFVVERLIAEATSGILSLQARVEDGELQALLDSHPALAPFGVWIDQQFDLPSVMSTIATWLSNLGAIFVRGSMLQVVEVLITFYLLFYFLRDATAAKAAILAWLPLSKPEADQLLRRVNETVQATVYGTDRARSQVLRARSTEVLSSPINAIRLEVDPGQKLRATIATEEATIVRIA